MRIHTLAPAGRRTGADEQERCPVAVASITGQRPGELPDLVADRTRPGILHAA